MVTAQRTTIQKTPRLKTKMKMDLTSVNNIHMVASACHDGTLGQIVHVALNVIPLVCVYQIMSSLLFILEASLLAYPLTHQILTPHVNLIHMQTHLLQAATLFYSNHLLLVMLMFTDTLRNFNRYGRSLLDLSPLHGYPLRMGKHTCSYSTNAFSLAIDYHTPSFVPTKDRKSVV